MAAVSAASLMLAVFIAWRLDKDDRSIRDWASGAVAMTLGMLLIASNGVLPDLVSAVPGNSLVALGLGYFYLGSRGVLGIARGKPWQWIAVGLAWPILLYSTFVSFNVSIRVVTLATLYAIFLIGCCVVFWRHGDSGFRSVDRLSALAFGLGALLFLSSLVGAVIVIETQGSTSFPEWIIVLPFLYTIPFDVWLGLVLTIKLSARITSRLAESRDRAEKTAAQLEDANRQLEVLSTTDKLTGICNRARLDDVLGRELLRVARHPGPISVLMLDIDHFKKVNDVYGHSAGDAVLIMVAKVLRASVRKTDTVGRWGGEEFLVVLPATGLASAADVGEKMRSEIERADFPEVQHLTVSVGVADHVADETTEQLMRRVDAALYEAKDRGRNRVVCA